MGTTNADGIASTLTEWIPVSIVVALGASSFAVVFMAAVIALAGFVGFRQIKGAAVVAARKAAEDRLGRYLESDEFRNRVRSEVSAETTRAQLAALQEQLTPKGKEAGNDQDQG